MPWLAKILEPMSSNVQDGLLRILGSCSALLIGFWFRDHYWNNILCQWLLNLTFCLSAAALIVQDQDLLVIVAIASMPTLCRLIRLIEMPAALRPMVKVVNASLAMIKAKSGFLYPRRSNRIAAESDDFSSRSNTANAEKLTTKQDDNQLLQHILQKIPASTPTSSANKVIGEIQS